MLAAVGSRCLRAELLSPAPSLISWLRLEQHVAHVYRQGPGCAGKAYHAKICACVAMRNTMRVCKCTEQCLWSGDIFRLWSAERLGWAAACSAGIKLQCVDRCWVPVWRPASKGLTHRCRKGGWRECLGAVIFISLLPQFNLANTGISPRCFNGWTSIATINVHSLTELHVCCDGANDPVLRNILSDLERIVLWYWKAEKKLNSYHTTWMGKSRELILQWTPKEKYWRHLFYMLSNPTHRLCIKKPSMTTPQKVKPKCLDRPLLTGCSKGLLHVSGWGMDQIISQSTGIFWLNF